MGCVISLGIGLLEIDWGKNAFFHNHSNLFSKDDLKPVEYHYYPSEDELVIELKPGYARKLTSVVLRLELLGYTLDACRLDYERLAACSGHDSPPIEFDSFASTLAKVDVDRVRTPGEPTHFDFGEYAVANILNDPEFMEFLPQVDRFDAGEFFDSLHPYVVLRLLAENPSNLDKDVCWRFADVVEGGYVDESSIYEVLADEDTFLIVTEGSSDTGVLKRSLPRLQPDVADFFRFVDMSENYPFTGLGNLANFYRGLSRIRIQNRVLFIFDNDTAGRAAVEKLRNVKTPSTLAVMHLPVLEECKRFRTLGPAGEALEDVNGRAVSVECFLDLATGCPRKPAVRWTSFDSSVGQYQGELIGKDAYTRAFFQAMDSHDESYDLSKLAILWSKIRRECVKLRSSRGGGKAQRLDNLSEDCTHRND